MLTDKAIRDAKPKEKIYSLTDGDNLYLIIMPTGAKTWQYRYKKDGKNHSVSLGKYPYVTRGMARQRAEAMREMRAHGVDPVENFKARVNTTGRTFADVADEWLNVQYVKTVTIKTYRLVKSRLERFIFPAFGEKSIAAITDDDIIAALEAIQKQQKITTMHNVKNAISAIFSYAKGHHYVKHNPVFDIERGTLLPIPRSKHFPAFIHEEDIRGLLRSFSHAKGHPWIEFALWLLAYTFVRPGNARLAEWSEFNSDFTTWVIPGEKMKSRETFIVPLATQVSTLLKDLLPITGSGRYVFPAARSGGKRPMSDMTINATLSRLGYNTQTEICAHGFRGTADTALRSHRVRAELIMLQMDHREGRTAEAAYNHADLLPDRRIMMQYWADYLDALAYGKPEPPVPVEIRFR